MAPFYLQYLYLFYQVSQNLYASIIYDLVRFGSKNNGRSLWLWWFIGFVNNTSILFLDSINQKWINIVESDGFIRLFIPFTFLVQMCLDSKSIFSLCFIVDHDGSIFIEEYFKLAVLVYL